MVRKTSLISILVLALLAIGTSANANVSVLLAGQVGICENASWIVYNVSETEPTTVKAHIGPLAYSWSKTITRTIAPGGFQTNPLTRKTTFTNQGPGDLSINCQRQRADRHDWKIDAGSGKTYQSDYHMDHVVPGTYIEPGFGMEEGHERGLTSVMGEKREGAR